MTWVHKLVPAALDDALSTRAAFLLLAPDEACRGHNQSAHAKHARLLGWALANQTFGQIERTLHPPAYIHLLIYAFAHLSLWSECRCRHGCAIPMIPFLSV